MGLFIKYLNVASDDLLPENRAKVKIVIGFFFSLHFIRRNMVIIIIVCM